ncbi:MAG: cyclic 2,3-diphosphoglycerate synthase [Candidatus Diapherotrites archaeon]|nr:cyclic 2,3-diphosphoglycerate synthase [Candidatus Micrarchaeota archaeon]
MAGENNGRKKVIIIGAAGTDFHYFNTVFRRDENYEVVAFTAQQIPGIGDRIYPPQLAGKLYPNGIPIRPREELQELIKKHGADECVQAYHDISYNEVMRNSAECMALGADFRLIGPKHSMIKSNMPVIAVCAVRTGSGKSQTSRKIVKLLKERGVRCVAVRHPMPYADLVKKTWERYEKYEDLEKYDCTIEEREEYEPYIERGLVIFSGVDYGKILEEAEKEADVILWDGGNNDVSFYKPDFYITVADPFRAGHEIGYFPGEVNARMADVIIINKVNTAPAEGVETVERNIRAINPEAKIIRANSTITLEDSAAVKGKKVLVVEDGPTLTHGELEHGAGYYAAKDAGAAELIDATPFAVGSIKETLQKFPRSEILPAMGYSDQQIKELEETINASTADVVVSGTPIDLSRVLKSEKPIIRANYELEEIGELTLEKLLDEFLQKHGLGK